jgi:putative FmdB family regulatory protein
MPTYEYGCEACGHGWELEQRISEDPVKKCPKCKKQKARRLISGANFILKGGGWYADLYHKPASSPPPASDSSESSSTKASSETKSSSDATDTTPKPEKKEKKKKEKKDAA